MSPLFKRFLQAPDKLSRSIRRTRSIHSSTSNTALNQPRKPGNSFAADTYSRNFDLEGIRCDDIGYTVTITAGPGLNQKRSPKRCTWLGHEKQDPYHDTGLEGSRSGTPRAFQHRKSWSLNWARPWTWKHKRSESKQSVEIVTSTKVEVVEDKSPQVEESVIDIIQCKDRIDWALEPRSPLGVDCERPQHVSQQYSKRGSRLFNAWD